MDLSQLNIPFGSDYVVLEIGAQEKYQYEEIYRRHHCWSYIYEPEKSKYEELRNKYVDNGRVSVYHYGSDACDSEFSLKNGEVGSLKDIKKIFSEIRKKEIDLLIIHELIKGTQKRIIHRLIETGTIKSVRRIVVERKGIEEVKKDLIQTHITEFFVEDTWEIWQIKLPTITIRDSNFFSLKYPERACDYFKWDWNGKKRDSYVTVFSDCHLKEAIRSDSAHKVAWLVEPPDINADIYREIKNLESHFDLIFTYHKNLLDRGEKYRFYPHGSSWIHPPDRKIYIKTKMTSAIFSAKKFTEGHKLRHRIANQFPGNIELMGRGYRSLENKVEGMQDYRFHVVVENCTKNYYFSEKLVDCFYTASIPIYYGLPDIGKFFDSEGIIIFKNLDQLREILNQIDEEEYEKRLPAVKRNFLQADEYSCMEKWLWLNGLRDLF